jgi:phenylacetate-CoA ligase
MRDTSDRIGFDPIETASRDEIEGLQLSRLQATLRHVYAHVAHTRAVWDVAGVHPDDVKVLSDIRRFPFTTKADLRANYPFGMFAVPREQVLRLHASSGTTGKPTVVGYSAADLTMWAHLMARSLYAAGTRAGEVVHIGYGYGLFTGGLGFHAGAERLGCTVVPMSGGMTHKQVTLIEDFGATTVCMTPSYMLQVLDEYRAQGRDARLSCLRTGVFGGEPWTNAMREEIEAALGIKAVDCYGLSEVIGPGVAMECVEVQDGLHIWEDHFLAEVIDPETGAVLPEGQMGELVLTSLTKEAMPIVRYRTRDLTRLLPGTARSMRRMEKVLGRSDDMMILRGVNVYPSQIEEQVLAVAGLSAHFQIEMTRVGRMDAMTVLVESADDAREALGAMLARRIKQMLGIAVAVRVGEPGSVARTTGKAVRVVDLRAV